MIGLDVALAILFDVALWRFGSMILPIDDPFRGTVVLLPWIIVALRACYRHLEAHTGRTVHLPGMPVALAVVLASLPARHSLGWPMADGLWAAALATLLAWALLACLPSLRRLLGRQLPENPSLLFLFLPLIAYSAILPWSLDHHPPDGDEPYYLLLSHSLAFDFDTDLHNNYVEQHSLAFMHRPLKSQPGDPRGPNGEMRSRHTALLPLLLAPAYRLAGRAGAAFVMALLTAVLAWMFLRLVRHYAAQRPRGALLAWAVLAFAPPLLIYSYQVWIEVPAALLLCFALERLRKLEVRVRRTDLLWFGSALILLALLKVRLLLLALPLLLLALVRLRQTRPEARVALAWIVAGPASAILALMAYNWWRFDNPLRMYSRSEWQLLASPPADYLRGAVGMFYDCAFGLFACAPLWLLLLPAAALMLRQRERLAVDALVVMTPYSLALMPRLEWYGGWAPPFRYPLVLLPLLALLLVPLLDDSSRRPGVRRLWFFFTPITALLALLWLVQPGWTYNLADGGSHILGQAGIQLGADVARLFPSAVRPRPATLLWVLGSLLLIPLTLWPRRGRKSARLLATAAALLALAALPVIAHLLPTRSVEMEDGIVQHRGGSLVPEHWQIQRPLYRSGWLVSARGKLHAPVVTGGPEVTLTVAAMWSGRGARNIDILAGDQPLKSWQVPASKGWHELQIGPVAWPSGEPLVILGPQRGRPRGGGVIVDRVAFHWH